MVIMIWLVEVLSTMVERIHSWATRVQAYVFREDATRGGDKVQQAERRVDEAMAVLEARRSAIVDQAARSQPRRVQMPGGTSGKHNTDR